MNRAAWAIRLEWAASLCRLTLREPTARLVLALALAAVLVGTGMAQRHAQRRQQAQFHAAAQEAADALRYRIGDYVQLLRGGAALLRAAPGVTQREWRGFASQLGFQARYPELQALAFAQVIDEAARPSLETRLRAEGFNAFRVWPEGARPRYAPVVLIDPLPGPHAYSLGFDIMSEAKRRVALERALESGEATLSPMLFLSSQGERERQAGGLLFLPVFPPGAGLASPQERRAAVGGFVYAVFHIEDLLREVTAHSRHRVTLVLSERDADAQQSVALEEDPRYAAAGEAVEEIALDLPGRAWFLRVQATDPFFRETDSLLPIVTAAGGGVLLILLLALLGLNARRLRHIEQRTEGMTAELQRGQERFRRVVEAMPSGMLIAGPDGRITFANRQLGEIFGYAEAELVGMRTALLLQAGEDDLGRLSPPAPGAGRYLRGRRRDGSEIPLEVALSQLHAGAQALLLAMVQDASTRQRHERDLAEATARAEAANAAKSEFLANMSHEIRTPLNAVLGMAQLLDYTQLDARQRDYLRMIHAGGNALLGLLSDILDFSKIEAGQFDIVAAPFRLAELLRGLHDLHAFSLRQKGLRLQIECAPEVPQWVEGDARRIQQVLVNLVGNAVKFTERGEVGLRIERADDAARADCVLLFRVRDTGIGMSAEQVGRLFAPFTQADASATRRFGGSGLGLVIAKRLVDRMGGDIGVRSQPGEGSEFWFKLPLKAVDPALPGKADPVSDGPQPQSVPLALRGLRVLLAEDNPINQTVALSLLQEAGVDVTPVGDGAQALQRLREAPQRYDLLLIDVQMPVMDGLQAARLIRRELRLSLPIVAMSAGVLPLQQEACAEAGMSDFIAKPLDAARVFAVLGRYAALAPGGPAAPAAAPATADAQPAIEGLSPAPALLSLGRQRSLYREVLRLFLREGAAFGDAVQACLAADDTAGASCHCHGLKSSAANIGAQRLHSLALEAEAALQRGAPAAAQLSLAAIEDELAQLLPRIAAALGPSAPATGEAAGAGEARETGEKGAESPDGGQLRALVSALRENDFQAIELFSGLRAALGRRLGEPAGGELDEAIEQLDFERALRLLRAHGLY